MTSGAVTISGGIIRGVAKLIEYSKGGEANRAMLKKRNWMTFLSLTGRTEAD